MYPVGCIKIMGRKLNRICSSTNFTQTESRTTTSTECKVLLDDLDDSQTQRLKPSYLTRDRGFNTSKKETAKIHALYSTDINYFHKISNLTNTYDSFSAIG